MRTLCLILLLACVGCSGCKPAKPPAKPSQTGNDIARIGVHGGDIYRDAGALKPFVLPPGEPLLSAIANKALAIIADAATAQKSHANDLNTIDWYDKNYAAVCQALKDEQGHLIGYQARLWGKVILAGGLLAIIAAYVARAFFPASLIGRALGHLLPWGTLLGGQQVK